MTTAVEIVRALGGRMRGSRGTARCPAHDDRTPSLSVGIGRYGRPLVCCHAGCSQDAVLAALAARGLWPGRDGAWTPPDPAEVARRKAETEAERGRARRAARKWWARRRRLTPDTPAGRYLEGRGLPGPWPASLAVLPSARHPSGARTPALIAAACRWPDVEVAAVQITHLTGDGAKADLEPVRWTRGVLAGAAVRARRWREDVPVALVEGVEDALAVAAAVPGVAAWATLGTANVAHVALPPDAEVVLVLDGDEVGRRAADLAVQMLTARGHRVRVAELPRGTDPAALLTADGAEEKA